MAVKQAEWWMDTATSDQHGKNTDIFANHPCLLVSHTTYMYPPGSVVRSHRGDIAQSAPQFDEAAADFDLLKWQALTENSPEYTDIII